MWWISLPLTPKKKVILCYPYLLGEEMQPSWGGPFVIGGILTFASLKSTTFSFHFHHQPVEVADLSLARAYFRDLSLYRLGVLGETHYFLCFFLGWRLDLDHQKQWWLHGLYFRSSNLVEIYAVPLLGLELRKNLGWTTMGEIAADMVIHSVAKQLQIQGCLRGCLALFRLRVFCGKQDLAHSQETKIGYMYG